MFSLSLDSLPRSAINLTLQEHAEAVMKGATCLTQQSKSFSRSDCNGSSVRRPR